MLLIRSSHWTSLHSSTPPTCWVATPVASTANWCSNREGQNPAARWSATSWAAMKNLLRSVSGSMRSLKAGAWAPRQYEQRAAHVKRTGFAECEKMQERSQVEAMNGILFRGHENKMRISFLFFMIRSRKLHNH